jgi:hypothetical protein
MFRMNTLPTDEMTRRARAAPPMRRRRTSDEMLELNYSQWSRHLPTRIGQASCAIHALPCTKEV